MGSTIRIILYLVIFALAMVFINTGFITDISSENSSAVSIKDDNVESVSPFDVFKDTKEQLESGMYPDKDTIPKCERDGNIEYAKEGKSCKTSSEQVLTCKDGLVSLNGGLSGKTLHLKSFDILVKCKDFE